MGIFEENFNSLDAFSYWSLKDSYRWAREKKKLETFMVIF